jgi:glycerol-3-phosphate dehydrogenase
MGPYDVIIIGGGVIGASIARELSRYKLKIAILEKEEELAFGVSKSNSGIIHPGTQNPVNSLKGRLCVQGNALTRKMSKELGIDFKEVGELIVAFNEEDRLKLVQLKDEAEALGVPRLRVVDRAWLRRNEPNLSREVAAALYAPTAGIISPYRWAYDLSENAAKNGVEIRTLTKVEKILPNSGAGARNFGNFEIYTSKGEFRSRYLINAAGLFADEISAQVGVDDFKIRPRKGEEFLLDKKKENITNHLIFPLPSKNSKGVLVIKTSDGNPMIGPTAEDVDDKKDLSTSEEGFKKVLSSARRLVPSINGDDVIAYFAGLRPVSGEDFIIRHEAKAPGFINVAGIQSPGLTAAPAIALMVLRLLKKNGLSLKRKLFFHRCRKKEIHLFNIPLSKTKRLIKRDPGYGDIVCRCETVSAKEVTDAIKRGAVTLDGIKFRTRAQSGRCHGSFCTTRLMKILADETGKRPTEITKRGKGSEIVKVDRCLTVIARRPKADEAISKSGIASPLRGSQ